MIQAWTGSVALPPRFLFDATTNWANVLLRANMRKHNDSNNKNNYTNNNKKTFDTLSYELNNYINRFKKFMLLFYL